MITEDFIYKEVLEEWNEVLIQLKKNDIIIEKAYQVKPEDSSYLQLSINFNKDKYQTLKDYSFDIISQVVLVEGKQYPIHKISRKYLLTHLETKKPIGYQNELILGCENHPEYKNHIRSGFVMLNEDLSEDINEINNYKTIDMANIFIKQNSMFLNLNFEDFKIMFVEGIKNDQNLILNVDIVKNIYELKKQLSDLEFIEFVNFVYYAFINNFKITELKNFIEIMRIKEDLVYNINVDEILLRLNL